MDESRWLNSTDPTSMLAFLQNTGRASERKLRLFACACCGEVQGYAEAAGEFREGLSLAERLAEGQAHPDEVRDFLHCLPRFWSGLSGEAWSALRHAVGEADPRDAATRAYAAADGCMGYAFSVLYSDDYGDRGRALLAERGAGLLRDLFGNPFRPLPPLDPAWLKWNDGTVRRLAEAIYEERAFERMPLLADALLDAGCGDEELLRHLQGPHVRGCWVVDLLTGRE